MKHTIHDNDIIITISFSNLFTLEITFKSYDNTSMEMVYLTPAKANKLSVEQIFSSIVFDVNWDGLNGSHEEPIAVAYVGST